MHKTSLVWISLVFVLFSKTATGQADTSFYIKKTYVIGNDQTKRRVIERELTFEEGDSLSMTAWREQKKASKQNLEQLNLFTKVDFEVRTDPIDSAQGLLRGIVIIRLQERWYIWPNIILAHADRNVSAFLYNWDYYRVNYGLHLVLQNLYGLNHTLRLKTRLGYKEEYGFSYKMPGIGQGQNHNIGLNASYFRQNEVLYLADDNEPLYYRAPEQYVQTNKRAGLSYAFRQGYRMFHNIDLSFDEISVTDSVRLLNPSYLGNNLDMIRWLELSYRVRFDLRDSRQYANEGYRLEAEIARRGLGLLSAPVMSHTIYKASAQGHYPLGGRFYVSSGVSMQVKDRKVLPYFFSSALGYSSFARGFELYLIDGKNYYVNRNELKYMILPRKYIKLKFVPLDQFNKMPISIYIKTFVDMAWVSDHDPTYNNPLGNMFLYSTGIGIDLVTYYDRILNLHYSVNKFGNAGFFIDFRTEVENIL